MRIKKGGNPYNETMIRQPHKYKYCVVTFLKYPNDIEKYICVPYSWVRFRNGGTQNVVVAYPLNENPEETKKRALEEQEYLPHWYFYLARVKFDTDDYNEAEEVIKLINNDGKSTSTRKTHSDPELPRKRPLPESNMQTCKKQATVNNKSEVVKNQSIRALPVKKFTQFDNSLRENKRLINMHIAYTKKVNYVDKEVQTQSLRNSVNQADQRNISKRVIDGTQNIDLIRNTNAYQSQNINKPTCTIQSKAEATCSSKLSDNWLEINTSTNFNISQPQPKIIVRRTTGNIPMHLTRLQSIPSTSAGLNSASIACQSSSLKPPKTAYDHRLLFSFHDPETRSMDEKLTRTHPKRENETCEDADDQYVSVDCSKFNEENQETLKSSVDQPVDNTTNINKLRELANLFELGLAQYNFKRHFSSDGVSKIIQIKPLMIKLDNMLQYVASVDSDLYGEIHLIQQQIQNFHKLFLDQYKFLGDIITKTDFENRAQQVVKMIRTYLKIYSESTSANLDPKTRSMDERFNRMFYRQREIYRNADDHDDSVHRYKINAETQHKINKTSDEQLMDVNFIIRRLKKVLELMKFILAQFELVVDILTQTNQKQKLLFEILNNYRTKTVDVRTEYVRKQKDVGVDQIHLLAMSENDNADNFFCDNYDQSNTIFDQNSDDHNTENNSSKTDQNNDKININDHGNENNNSKSDQNNENDNQLNNIDHKSKEKEDPLMLMLKNRWTFAQMYLYEVNRTM